MYISARTGQIANDMVAATTFALEVAEVVEEATGSELSVWQGTLGTPMGMLSWSSQVASFAEAATREQKLMESAQYIEMVQQAGNAGLFVPGSLDNHFARVLHSAGPQGPVEYIQMIQARVATGKLPDALAFATDMADYASDLTGNQVTVAGSNWGDPGTMIFFTGHASADSVDASQDATMGDAGYQERLARAADIFVDGTAVAQLAKRLR